MPSFDESLEENHSGHTTKGNCCILRLQNNDKKQDLQATPKKDE